MGLVDLVDWWILVVVLVVLALLVCSSWVGYLAPPRSKPDTYARTHVDMRRVQV